MIEELEKLLTDYRAGARTLVRSNVQNNTNDRVFSESEQFEDCCGLKSALR
jgi:hypothetical protein